MNRLISRLTAVILATLISTTSIAADWNKPALTDTYVNFLGYLSARLNDSAMQMDSSLVTPTNQPSGTKRWNAASSKWEKWSGFAWSDMAATYGISISGNAGTATSAGNADTLDGSHASAFATAAQGAKADAAQPSVSAINTGNISSQSVNYANSAGSAPANGGTSAACSGNAATATNADKVDGYHAALMTTSATIPVSGSYGYLNTIYETILSASASSINITGLNGDSDLVYELIIRAAHETGAGTVKLTINGDSSAVYAWSFNNAANVAAQTYISLGGIGTTNIYSGRILIFAKSGTNRNVVATGASHAVSPYSANCSGVWDNTGSNVTSVTLSLSSGNFAVGTMVILRRLL